MSASDDSNIAESTSVYDRVAREYYDQRLHPTCANFRAASEIGLGVWLERLGRPTSTVLEVGAGRSIFAEYLLSSRKKIGQLIISDESSRMLDYSRDLKLDDAILIRAPAHAIPCESNSQSCIVASLGDPFNVPAFWAEANRLLGSGGRTLFTTPSHEWAMDFRREGEVDVAEFRLKDGSRIEVPSIILDVDSQIDLMRGAGFRTLAVIEVMLEQIGAGLISPKLMRLASLNAPILRAYMVEK